MQYFQYIFQFLLPWQMLQDYCLNFGVDASRYLSSLKLSDSSLQTQNISKCLADNRSSKNDCSAKCNLRQNSHRRLKAIKRRKCKKKGKYPGAANQGVGRATCKPTPGSRIVTPDPVSSISYPIMFPSSSFAHAGKA